MIPLKPFSYYIEYHAKRNPDRVCLGCEEREYTYKEMYLIISFISKKLFNYGINSKSVIGIYAKRSELIPIFILSIIKAGATYVPLHEDFPLERLAHIIKDAQIDVILTDNNDNSFKFSDKEIMTLVINIECIENIIKQIILYEYEDLLPTLISNRAAIYYTSGSSGRPKGVVHTNESIMTSNLSECKTLNLTANDKLLLVTHWTICFSITAFEIIIMGGSLYVASDDMCMDLNILHQYVEGKKISIIHMPTQIGFQYTQLFPISGIRLLYVGGSPFPTLKNMVTYDIINVYGSTEGMALSFSKCVIGGDKASLGVPYNHTKWFVVDEQGNRVKKGDVGELWVSSKCVSIGYLNLPELSQRRFFLHKGVHSFATNDLVKENFDGSFTYIGRKDMMIKVRGIRIEPEEITFNLLQHKDISQACVCLKKVNNIDYLCAYYVQINCGLHITDKELSHYLSANLPNSMIPSFFIKVNALPLNNRGKVDYDSLPNPNLTISFEKKPQIDELSLTEKILIKTIRDTLRIFNVNINDNFFLIGGDSLSALLIATKLRIDGYQITANTIKTSNSIKEIAAKMEQINNIEEQPKEGNKYANNGSLIRYVIENNKQQVFNHFIIPDFIRSDKRINILLLYKSIRTLVSYHQILGSRYKDESLCYLNFNSDIFINEYTLDDKLDSFKEQLKILINSFYCSFDITNSLFKVILIHLNKNDLIVFGTHHMISDAISKANIVRDFCHIYCNYLQNRKSSFVENNKPISYKSYRETLEEYYACEMALEERLYWDNIRYQLPKPILDKNNNENIFIEIDTTLEPELTKDLLSISKRYKKGLLTICVSALYNVIKHVYCVGTAAIQIFLHGRKEQFNYAFNDNPYAIGSSVGCFVINPPIIIEEINIDDGVGLLSHIDYLIDNMPNEGIGFDATGGYSKCKVPSFGIDMLGNKDVLFSDDIYAGCFTKYRGLPHGKPISHYLDMGCSYLIFAGINKGRLFFKVRYGQSFISDRDAKLLLDEIVYEIHKIMITNKTCETSHK